MNVVDVVVVVIVVVVENHSNTSKLWFCKVCENLFAIEKPFSFPISDVRKRINAVDGFVFCFAPHTFSMLFM